MHFDREGIVVELKNRYLREEDYTGNDKPMFDEAMDELKKANFASSAELLAKLADKGDPVAQYHLGILYSNAPNLKDDKKAFELYKLSAEKDYAPAQAMVGATYAEGSLVVKDARKAVEYFGKSAEQGEIHGLFNLAHHYEKGDGVNVDIHKADKLYKESANKGDGEAAFRVGRIQLIQYNNDLEAQQWFEKGVEKDPYTSFAIGLSYMEGVDGFPVDEDKGNYWLDIAEKKGIAHAAEYRRQKAQEAVEMMEYYRTRANSNSGGCFIATAVYESHNSEQVLEFRRYRDDVLSKTGFGRHFIKLYYSISPAIANFIRDKSILKLLIKTIFLDPIFRFLQSRNQRKT